MVLFWILITNTAANLKRQNIASGFGFVDRTAGFDVSQHLIPFDASMTYGRAFLVGLLNTLLVAGLGIVLATILGFVIGIARLSTNWLVARLATVYVEVIRNVPLLLQLFFWYFAVLKSLPVPRQSLRAARRRIPQRARALSAGAGARAWLRSGGADGPHRRGRRPSPCISWRAGGRCATGQRLPVLWITLALDRAAAARRLHRDVGQPLSFDYPELKGFNFQGGMVMQPEFVALLLGLSIYTASFIAEIVRSGIQGVSKGQKEAALAIGLSKGQIAAPRRHPAGHAHHHPAADQPVPEPDQELVAGRGHRLPRSGRRSGPARCSTRPARRSR